MINELEIIYLTKDFLPCDHDNADIVKVVYPDGRIVFGVANAQSEPLPSASLSRKPSTTSDQSLKRNLEMMRQFKSNQADFSGWAYKSSLEMVLREGRFCKVTDAELPDGIEYGDVKSAYKNALELSLDNDQLTYVEGYALTELSGGMAFPHAWVIDANGEVIDNTWRMKGTSYFGVPFKSEFVNSVHENFGMYGVIPEIPTEQYNPFKYGFEFYELGGKGSGFHGHAGRDAANLRGGSVARGAGVGSGDDKYKAVKEFELDIVMQDYETAGIFDETGKLVFRKDGGENEVFFTEDEIKVFLHNGILAHNHPSGGPFSADDIEIFNGAQLNEIRAVGQDYTYILRVPKGAPKLQVGQYWMNDFRSTAYKVQQEIREKGYKMEWQESNHLVCTRFFEKYGLEYIRERTR